MQTKLICGVCGSNLMLIDDTYVCQECGMETETDVEIDAESHPTIFDGYWTQEDEKQVNEELDNFFYQKYPQFRKH